MKDRWEEEKKVYMGQSQQVDQGVLNSRDYGN